MSARQAVALVARREIVERSREKSFLVSAGINIAIVVAVILLSVALGGDEEYVVGYVSPDTQAVAEAAERAAAGSDSPVEIRNDFSPMRSVISRLATRRALRLIT